MKYNVSIIKFEELQRIISDIDYLPIHWNMLSLQ